MRRESKAGAAKAEPSALRAAAHGSGAEGNPPGGGLGHRPSVTAKALATMWRASPWGGVSRPEHQYFDAPLAPQASQQEHPRQRIARRATRECVLASDFTTFFRGPISALERGGNIGSKGRQWGPRPRSSGGGFFDNGAQIHRGGCSDAAWFVNQNRAGFERKVRPEASKL
jgi:hypothetical protein